MQQHTLLCLLFAEYGHEKMLTCPPIHYTNRREIVNFPFSYLFHDSLIPLIKIQWETFRRDLKQTLLCVRCVIFRFFIQKNDFLTTQSSKWCTLSCSKDSAGIQLLLLCQFLFINSWIAKYLQFVCRNHFNSIPFHFLNGNLNIWRGF